MTGYDAKTEEKLSALKAWLGDETKSEGLVDIQFCPKELDAGSFEDYVADVFAMVKAFQNGQYTDITSTIL